MNTITQLNEKKLQNIIYERATRVVIHSYLYSGLRPLVRWKTTPDNGNLRNLRYTKIFVT